MTDPSALRFPGIAKQLQLDLLGDSKSRGEYTAILLSASTPYCFYVPTTPAIVSGFLGFEPKMLADGIFVRPKALREPIVDYGHLPALARVVVREKAPVTRGISHSSEAIGTGET